MPHYAKLQTNRVIQVIETTQEKISSGEYGDPTYFVECQPYSNERKLRGCIGDSYIEESNIFAPPKPFASWTLSEELGTWLPPHFQPNNDLSYRWDEDALDWIVVE